MTKLRTSIVALLMAALMFGAVSPASAHSTGQGCARWDHWADGAQWDYQRHYNSTTYHFHVWLVRPWYSVNWHRHDIICGTPQNPVEYV